MTDRRRRDSPSTRRATHCVTTLRPCARDWTALAGGDQGTPPPFDPTAETLRSVRSAFAPLAVRGQPPSARGRGRTGRGGGVVVRRDCTSRTAAAGQASRWPAASSKVRTGARSLPSAPLRYWRLVDLDPRRDGSLSHARLLIGERTLHHLLGLVYLDDSLHALLSAVARRRRSLAGAPRSRDAHLEAALVGCRQRVRRDRRRRPVAAQRRGARVRGSRAAAVRPARRRRAGRRDGARPPGARLDAGSAAVAGRPARRRRRRRRRSPRSPIESARRWSISTDDNVAGRQPIVRAPAPDLADIERTQGLVARRRSANVPRR